jgi:UDP-N-acetylmuramoyl-tripeptide--D-alanyl-D-alanine ligase
MQALIDFAKGRNTCLDSRQLSAGDIFFAIRGEQVDGHQYLKQAISAGASAVVVDHSVDVSVPSFVVDDTLNALQQLAAAHRLSMSNLKAIAVTGSCGKTTTRAFLESIFAQAGPTVASIKSYNNHVGVPLTLLNIAESHHYLISEVGMSHPGEIAPLAELVKPDVAIVTNIGPAHLGHFGALKNIAAEKADLFNGLSTGGVAIVNSDDDFADYLKSRAAAYRTLTFGVEHAADISASCVKLTSAGEPGFNLKLPNAEKQVQLSMLGQHNVYNALAAAAAGYALGLSIDQIVCGLELAQTEACRLKEYHLANDILLIDDSYNANPLSTRAALTYLSACKGEKIFIFADMKELGDNVIAMHAEIGRFAKALGVEYFIGFGEMAAYAVEAFGERGHAFMDKSQLIAKVQSMFTKNQIVLVKGSNSMHMSNVVQALIETDDVS